MLKSLQEGKDGEVKVAELLKRIGVVEFNTTKAERLHYDLSFENREVNFKIEVKNDKYAARSGNVALEIHNSRKNSASGLYATKAEIWAHLFNDGVYLGSVEEMKRFAQNNEPKKRIISGGDGNANLLIYDIDDVVDKILFRVDNLTEPDFKVKLYELLSYSKACDNQPQ